MAIRAPYAKRIAEPLLRTFSQEKEPEALEQIAEILHQTALYFIKFGEYYLASWVFIHLKERLRELQESKDNQYQRVINTLLKPLEPTVIEMLMDDIKSSVASRQQEATLFLSSMDMQILPHLINLIKKEGDLRVRQLAAHLIQTLGIEAVQSLKRELVLEFTAEDRIRILEIIDTVTQDLQVELSYALSDERPQVRRAAFRLAERLDNEQIAELLCEYAQIEKADVAIQAIKSLGRLKVASAVNVLISILNKAKGQEVQTACCVALGQIADPGSMEPLIHILTQKGRMFLQKKYSDSIRSAAAAALAQIHHPRVMEVFKSFSEDRDPRIRQTARNILKDNSTMDTKSKTV